jgi:hypothetical protein
VTRTDKQEAHELSDSSIFFSEKCFVLKRCGITLWMTALVPLLKLAGDSNRLIPFKASLILVRISCNLLPKVLIQELPRRNNVS